MAETVDGAVHGAVGGAVRWPVDGTVRDAVQMQAAPFKAAPVKPRKLLASVAQRRELHSQSRQLKVVVEAAERLRPARLRCWRGQGQRGQRDRSDDAVETIREHALIPLLLVEYRHGGNAPQPELAAFEKAKDDRVRREAYACELPMSKAVQLQLYARRA